MSYNDVSLSDGHFPCQALAVYGAVPRCVNDPLRFVCLCPEPEVCVAYRRYCKASDGKWPYRGEFCGGCAWSHYEVAIELSRVVDHGYIPSLDHYGSSSAVERGVIRGNGAGGCWTRQQKRGYHRILSCLQYWQSNGYQVLWLMLSTAAGGNKALLAEHHGSLLKRVERKGFPRVEHFQIRTGEGNGVLHVLWAWKAADGMLQKSFYLPQRWLSESWEEIHGACVVWISRVGRSGEDTRRVSRYCISQYVGGQSFYEYMSYSWVRTFGFPLVSCWRSFKALLLSFSDVRREWSRFLGGHVVRCEYGGFCMGSIRLGYKEYGSDFWDMLHWG